MKNYPKNKWNYDAMTLTSLYRNSELDAYPVSVDMPASARKVYGDLRFPESHDDRAYTAACFVASVDGKVSFPDRPAGPVVAQANSLDPEGAKADFWLLNLLRFACDVIICGAGTLQKEPDGSACLFDQDLEDHRVAHGMQRAPRLLVCSYDGTDIPYGDTVFSDLNYMIHTSPDGYDAVQRGLRHPCYAVGPFADESEAAEHRDRIIDEFHAHDQKAVPVILTGRGSTTDAHALLRVLKYFGMDRALVESPTYTHVLMRGGLLDEIALNCSCLFIGGKAVGFGSTLPSFTADNHPHSRMLSIHMHSPSFFYFRHRMVYDSPSQ